MFISIKTIWLPKAVDCECGKLESNLVSVISKIPTLFLIIGFNWPYFLGSELIIKWLTTYLFIFFSLNLFKCTTVSQGSIFWQLLILPTCFIKSDWPGDSAFFLAIFHEKLLKQNVIYLHKTSELLSVFVYTYPITSDIITTASKVFIFGVTLGGILIRIQSECRKIQTRITPNTDTFYTVYVLFFHCQWN